jgi:hypothetical protein
MKLNWILLSLSLLPASMQSQSYNVTLVPDSLQESADMVVRLDDHELEIISPAKAVAHEKVAYTILNEKGARYARYVNSYDKFFSINNATAVLYDAAGKEVRKVKKKDMQDLSGSGEESLMSDNRYKSFDFYCRTYPYTVVFETGTEMNGLLAFEGMMPMTGPNMSVVYSRYTITAPADYAVRYRPVNCTLQPVVQQMGNKKNYTWEMKNMPAIIREPYAPDMSELVPNIRFAPSVFEVDGYKGDMSTWAGFGKFINTLLQGRDVLPDAVKARVHQLTDNLSDPKQKAVALYDYLQKNTRYISVQLGIGGWQPFDAKYVADRKYGDCKALSNFMVALLKEAGMHARYVVITGGEDAKPILGDFPSLQGNHVISCIPMAKDTLWLECTSQTVSPGFMGSFTGDRQALLIDEDGAHLVNTPVYRAADNLKVRVVSAVIDAAGNLDASISTRYTGVQQEMPHALIREASRDEREKYLNNTIGLPTYQVDKSNYEEERAVLPAVKEFLHLTSASYASVSGKRIFVAPNIMDKSNLLFSSDSTRKFDIKNVGSFRDIDSISIKLPEGYVPESMPKEVTLDTRFGKYHSRARVDGDRIYYNRLYEKSRDRFPASAYADLLKFQEEVYTADRAHVVLVKK